MTVIDHVDAVTDGDLDAGTVQHANSSVSEVPTLVLSELPQWLDGVWLREPIPDDEPLAAVPAQRTVDARSARLIVVTAKLDPEIVHRVRIELAELETVLSEIDPAVVLPLLDHGQDPDGRPYLLVAEPGEAAADARPDPVAAARALGEGLRQLAERGVVAIPPPLHRTADGYVLGTPLPPALQAVLQSRGVRNGHEPPEVLAGEGWTPSGQVYACSIMLIKLTAPGSQVREVLRRQLVAEPRERLASPTALAQTVAAALPTSTQTYVSAPAVGGRPLGSLYDLMEPIGRGATGVVWSARRRTDAVPLAVKLLRSELANDPTVLTRFLRERHILVRLNHPHLVRVHDVVAEGGALGIVMDLVAGENLRQRLARGPMQITEAAALLSQLADALAAVHHAGLVHRDVKPENVMITKRDGVTAALLTDFGTARTVEGSTHTQAIGTPAYLAPELATGGPPEPPVDVYSLGVTAYELVAGRAPFTAPTSQALLRAHVDLPASRPDGLPDDVWALIEACLRKQPQERPKAPELAFAWARLAGVSCSIPLPAPAPMVQDTNLSARPLAIRPKEPQQRRSYRRLIAVAAVLGVLGAGGGAVVATVNRGGRQPGATGPTTSSQPVTSNYLVPATTRLGDSVITVNWNRNELDLPGLTGFLVVDTNVHPVSTALPADVTTFTTPVEAGQQSCFLVIALGVTAPQKDPPVQPVCVNP